MEAFLTRSCVLSWPHAFVQWPRQGGGDPDSQCSATACRFLSQDAEHSAPWSSQSAGKQRVRVQLLITGAGCHRGPALAESLCQHLFSPGPGSAAEPPEERVSSAMGTDSCPYPGGRGLQAIAVSEIVPCHFPRSYGAGTSCAAAQFCFWSSPSPPEPRGAQRCGRCRLHCRCPARLYRCRRAEGSCLQ